MQKLNELPSAYSLLSLLPQTNCVSPKAVKEAYDKSTTGQGMLAVLVIKSYHAFADLVLVDESVFRSKSVQRVYQYLRRYMAKQDLHSFTFNAENIEGKPDECLNCITR